MTILKQVPNAIHIKEFYGGYTGTCTQTSAAMCLAAAQGEPTTHDGVVALMLEMTRSMIWNGKAGANGAATVSAMAEELRRRGAAIALELDYQEPLSADWHTILKLNAGSKPILLQIARAANLYDVAGTHEDSGVQYHAIAIMGIADTGYLVFDPNNPTVELGGDIYPYAALAAAVPCGLIMLNVKSQLPAGVTDDGTTLTFPGGVTMTEGFRDVWLANQATLGLALANDIATGSDGSSLQVCALGVLVWDTKTVTIQPFATPFAALCVKYAMLGATNADLQRRLSAADAATTTAQTQASAATAKIAAALKDLS